MLGDDLSRVDRVAVNKILLLGLTDRSVFLRVVILPCYFYTIVINRHHRCLYTQERCCFRHLPPVHTLRSDVICCGGLVSTKERGGDVGKN